MSKPKPRFVPPDDIRVYSATEVGLALGGISEDSVARLWDNGSLPFIVLTNGQKKPRRGTLHSDLLGFIADRRGVRPVAEPLLAMPVSGLTKRRGPARDPVIVPMRVRSRKRRRVAE
jgi:hypothetical protein